MKKAIEITKEQLNKLKFGKAKPLEQREKNKIEKQLKIALNNTTNKNKEISVIFESFRNAMMLFS